ncbi:MULTISPECIES: Gfo/Idh/MocA family protein [unclassified Streptomyces]|uniref:Gfo/Idh/MocA family protein n=1 Tax=unclassified Streptomyces TaxID=2593676 RepID=UPI002252F88A|nr:MULTISPECIES: Gfo/Idh/MocA family oxidoreductase [unclassified Streptomyces]MCX4529046.1 Gfo/Idh/MocA family oxidoreductase [Streptomyces sp. NBC_01551]MCX4540271.1 Gfo/Idh/MocA family oxidoreductase [Streptomyces sp. NBC_01565]
MKVGVIGLGDIARKAYLPVLTTRPGIELHLQTRTPATLELIGGTHHIPAARRHTDLDGLLAAGLDAAFVHAPTDVHPEIVTRLLEAGVPTYVDKPLAYELADARRLVELAEERGVSLCVGFNRRHAPGYAQCADHPRELIVMQKNRVGLPEDPRTLVLDDFIHVVDTLRFLLPGEADHIDVRAVVREGLMHQVVLQMSGEGFTALGIMNRLSGSTEEVLEVSGQDSKRQVVNLAEIIDHKGQPTVRRRGDWVPVARQRGIEQVVDTFLEAVQAGKTVSARDALLTHELCERVVLSALEQAARS